MSTHVHIKREESSRAQSKICDYYIMQQAWRWWWSDEPFHRDWNSQYLTWLEHKAINKEAVYSTYLYYTFINHEKAIYVHRHVPA